MLIIDKDVFEKMLILLYKFEEFEACAALLESYKRFYHSKESLH